MSLEDLRCALRTLAKHPGFTANVVLMLALGIGANAAVFSVIDAVLLKPLSYPQPDRIVTLWDTSLEQDRDHEGPSPGNMADWRELSTSFGGMAAWYAGKPVTLQGEREAEKIVAASVTEDFFGVFGTPPLLGRGFDAGESATQDRVVVLSHDLWQRRFGRDAAIIGSRIVLDGNEHTVIGVMPADFAIPNREVGIWNTWNFNVAYAARPGGVPRDARFLEVAGRLKEGVTIAQAQAEMDSIAAKLAAEYPQANRNFGVRLIALHDEVVGDVRTALWVLFGAVGFVLLIACTNIANLLLARGSTRGREIAVRAVLGASRARIIRQLLTESVTIAVSGAIVGMLFAYVALRALALVAPADLPRLDSVAIDARVFAFASSLGILTGILCGIIPAVHFSRTDLSKSLRDGGSRTATSGRTTQRFRASLAVLEIAAALTLLVGAGLMVRGFSQLVRVDPGFDYRNVLVVRAFPDERIYAGAEKRLTYFNALAERLSGLPSVESVGATTGLPLNEFNNAPQRPYWPDDLPNPGADGPKASLKMTTGNYFKTMGIAMLDGRDFTNDDDLDAPMVVIVNDALARGVWPGQNAVGKRLVIDYAQRGIYPYEVIGVVESSRADGLRKEAPPEIFLAHAQVPYAQMNFVLRTSSDPMSIARAAQREVLELDPSQPVHSVTTMEDLVSRSVAQDRFSLALILVLAFLACALALFGVYGVMSYSVSRRSHEIGVRVALGARRADVVRLVVLQAGMIAAAGITVGLAASFALTRVLSTLLFEVSATDPAIFLGAPVLLAAASLAAGYIPAMRATRIDPIQVLRSE